MGILHNDCLKTKMYYQIKRFLRFVCTLCVHIGHTCKPKINMYFIVTRLKHRLIPYIGTIRACRSSCYYFVLKNSRFDAY